MTSVSTFTTTHDDGTKVTVIIKVTQDHYPTWVKWVKIYEESPISYGLERKE